MIIDAHTHLLPSRLALKIRSFFEAHVPTAMAYPLDYREVLDRHHGDGVTAVWNLPYSHKSGMSRALNESMLEVSDSLADHPVSVIPGCTIHPNDTDPVADFDIAIDAGARVLKLHCSVGDYEPDDPRIVDVLRRAGERSVPIVIHAGHGVDGSTHTHELAPIGRAADAAPGATLILAHFGHHSSGDAVLLLGEHPNLIADLTPVLADAVPLDPDVVTRFADRLLFGSDAPNTGLTAGTLIERVASLAVDASVRDSVLSGNARRLVPTTA